MNYLCRGKSESDGITFIDIDIVSFNSSTSIRAEQLHLRIHVNILLDVKRMWLLFPSEVAKQQSRHLWGETRRTRIVKNVRQFY